MILDSFNLNGKVAIVTGSSTGLGQGMALGLAEAGADIVGVDYVPSPDTEEQITALGRNYLPVTADLSSIEPIGGIIDKAIETYGHIDILVNNAGIIRREDAIDFTEKNWDEVMNLNIKSLFFFSQAAARQFITQESGGKIVNTASLLSFQGGIRVPSYTASKSGVAGVTRLMANEWAPHGINVNAIAPGYMATNNTEALRADKVRSAELFQRIPAKRWGEPSDLKGAVVFLASPASDYVTGHVLVVDGGWMAR